MPLRDQDFQTCNFKAHYDYFEKKKNKTQQFGVMERDWTHLLKDTELVSFQLLCRALLTGSNPQEKAETRIAHGRSSVLDAVSGWEKDNKFGRSSWGTSMCKGWISNCIHEFEESSWWYWFVDALGLKCMGSENSVFYLCYFWIRIVYILLFLLREEFIPHTSQLLL